MAEADARTGARASYIIQGHDLQSVVEVVSSVGGTITHELGMIESIEVKREALDELCSRYHVRSLEVFGSAATGKLRDDSDLDFLVDFRAVDSMSLADQYFGLLRALEELFGRKVDLLTRRSLRIPVDCVSRMESCVTSLLARAVRWRRS